MLENRGRRPLNRHLGGDQKEAIRRFGDWITKSPYRPISINATLLTDDSLGHTNRLDGPRIVDIMRTGLGFRRRGGGGVGMIAVPGIDNRYRPQR